MELSWKDWARVHAPFLIVAAFTVIGSFYSFAYKQGQKSMLWAAERASVEAKTRTAAPTTIPEVE